MCVCVVTVHVYEVQIFYGVCDGVQKRLLKLAVLESRFDWTPGRQAVGSQSRLQLGGPSDVDRSIPDADAGDESSQLGDASRPITDRHHEPTQSTVRRQTAIQTATEYRRVDVTATQRYHHPTMPEQQGSRR